MRHGTLGRALGAAMFAAVCVVLAATGHVLMSGVPLTAQALIAAFAVTGAAGWLLGRGERGLLAVVTAAVVAQFLLHVGFSLLSPTPHPGDRPTASSARMHAEELLCGPGRAEGLTEREAAALLEAAGLEHLAAGHAEPPPEDAGHSHTSGSGHGALGAGDGSPHAGGGGPLTSLAHFSGAGMFTAHLLAALLSGLWLAYGERAAFQVLRSFAGWLFGPLALWPEGPASGLLPEPARMPRQTRARVSPRRVLLCHSVVLRGPPVVTAVA